MARDEWLALACQRGRPEAFEELVRKMERPLLYYVTKLLLEIKRLQARGLEFEEQLRRKSSHLEKT